MPPGRSCKPYFYFEKMKIVCDTKFFRTTVSHGSFFRGQFFLDIICGAI